MPYLGIGSWMRTDHSQNFHTNIIMIFMDKSLHVIHIQTLAYCPLHVYKWWAFAGVSCKYCQYHVTVCVKLEWNGPINNIEYKKHLPNQINLFLTLYNPVKYKQIMMWKLIKKYLNKYTVHVKWTYCPCVIITMNLKIALWSCACIYMQVRLYLHQ